MNLKPSELVKLEFEIYENLDAYETIRFLINVKKFLHESIDKLKNTPLTEDDIVFIEEQFQLEKNQNRQIRQETKDEKMIVAAVLLESQLGLYKSVSLAMNLDSGIDPKEVLTSSLSRSSLLELQKNWQLRDQPRL